MTHRRRVSRFAEHMINKLKVNLYKGGWQQETNGYLIRRLRQEVEELRDAIRDGRSAHHIINEAADVANFAMMIADRCEVK